MLDEKDYRAISKLSGFFYLIIVLQTIIYLTALRDLFLKEKKILG